MNKKWLNKLQASAVSNSLIDTELYTRYEVKRGLRDLDGKGVLAGLTRIGDVQASEIIDGKSCPAPGRLIYRGIDINNLVQGFLQDNRNGFEEICYLLLFGEQPGSNELSAFEKLLVEHRKLPYNFIHDSILKVPSRDVMNALARTVLALYATDNNPDGTDISNVLQQALTLIATFPLLTVYSYQAHAFKYKNESLVIHSPDPELGTAANFLHMLRHNSEYTPLEAQLLDLALVLHAEHGGGNNSSFTMHVVTSSGTDSYSATAAALGSLKGPRHGGANIKVIQMFDDLKKTVKNWDNDTAIKEYLDKLLKKEAFDQTGLIYGFGHAVYSISDPRTVIIRDQVKKLALEKNMEAEYSLYRRVEQLAPDIIAGHRKIYKGVSANVDFYSGLLYKLLAIPEELFTPLFAMSRIAGWSAHRIEELANTGKIIRPAYKSVVDQTPYIPLTQRP